MTEDQRCPECAELGHRYCYEAGRLAGREDAARDIREITSTLCMDGVGRHLVDTCAWVARGGRS